MCLVNKELLNRGSRWSICAVQFNYPSQIITILMCSLTYVALKMFIGPTLKVKREELWIWNLVIKEHHSLVFIKRLRTYWNQKYFWKLNVFILFFQQALSKVTSSHICLFKQSSSLFYSLILQYSLYTNLVQRHCLKSVQIRTRKNSVYEHFSRSECLYSSLKNVQYLHLYTLWIPHIFKKWTKTKYYSHLPSPHIPF